MLIERVEEWSREIEARAEKKWLKQGMENGSRELLLRQLEARFGPIDDRTQAKVNAAGRELLPIGRHFIRPITTSARWSRSARMGFGWDVARDFRAEAPRCGGKVCPWIRACPAAPSPSGF